MTLKTPSGMPASVTSLASSSAVTGVWSLGLTTIVQPVGERGRELPGQQQQRRVPRHDGGHDADRLAPREGDEVRLVGRDALARDLVRPAREVAVPGRRARASGRRTRAAACPSRATRARRAGRRRARSGRRAGASGASAGSPSARPTRPRTPRARRRPRGRRPRSPASGTRAHGSPGVRVDGLVEAPVGGREAPAGDVQLVLRKLDGGHGGSLFLPWSGRCPAKSSRPDTPPSSAGAPEARRGREAQSCPGGHRRPPWRSGRPRGAPPPRQGPAARRRGRLRGRRERAVRGPAAAGLHAARLGPARELPRLPAFLDALGAASGAEVVLCPHGKTSMIPELFRRQLEDGCWGITTANAQQTRVAQPPGCRGS